MRLLLATCIGGVLLSARPTDGGPRIFLHDDFDDGAASGNAKGIGGGWKARSIWAADAVEEADGAFTASLNAEHASYALMQRPGIFNFWNPAGAVAEFVIRDTAINTKHEYRVHVAFVWQFGVISADRTGPEVPWMGSWFKEGAIWFCIGRKDASSEAKFQVHVYNSSLTSNGQAEPHDNTPGFSTPVAFTFNIKYPATVRVHANQKGFRFELPGQDIGEQKTAFGWAELGSAAITTEFKKGAWTLVHARINGTTGKAGDLPLQNGPNIGRLERVTVSSGEVAPRK